MLQGERRIGIEEYEDEEHGGMEAQAKPTCKCVGKRYEGFHPWNALSVDGCGCGSAYGRYLDANASASFPPARSVASVPNPTLQFLNCIPEINLLDSTQKSVYQRCASSRVKVSERTCSVQVSCNETVSTSVSDFLRRLNHRIFLIVL